MKPNAVVDLARHRESRNARVTIMEKLAVTNWISAEPFWKAQSEVTVYLCDSSAETVVVFPCTRFDLAQAHVGLPVWEHLVRSFDVIVDPVMTFDEVHLCQTVDLAIHALGGSESLVLPGQKTTESAVDRLHYVVSINRSKLAAPVGIKKICRPTILLTPGQIQAITQELCASND